MYRSLSSYRLLSKQSLLGTAEKWRSAGNVMIKQSGRVQRKVILHLGVSKYICLLLWKEPCIFNPKDPCQIILFCHICTNIASCYIFFLKTFNVLAVYMYASWASSFGRWATPLSTSGELDGLVQANSQTYSMPPIIRRVKDLQLQDCRILLSDAVAYPAPTLGSQIKALTVLLLQYWPQNLSGDKLAEGKCLPKKSIT